MFYCPLMHAVFLQPGNCKMCLPDQEETKNLVGPKRVNHHNEFLIKRQKISIHHTLISFYPDENLQGLQMSAVICSPPGKCESIERHESRSEKSEKQSCVDSIHPPTLRLLLPPRLSLSGYCCTSDITSNHSTALLPTTQHLFRNQTAAQTRLTKCERLGRSHQEVGL